METTVYKRVLKKYMNIGEFVSIVGRIKENRGSSCVIDTGKGETVVIEGINIDHLDNPVFIEVRGDVQDSNTLKFHEVNSFGDEKFDINNFHEILSLYLEHFNHLLM